MSSLGVPAASRATSSTTPNSRSSRPSSPASTPTIARIAQENNARKHLVDQNVPVVVEKNVTVGLLDEATLAKILPPWRIALRRGLAKSLELEMPILEAIQNHCRTPALDVYFVKTSLLGSHGFFMIFIPTFFWFGWGSVGRGLLYVLAAGGYSTSVLKDLFCIARPFSPPLARLSVGNHHHEYGFPSTHSTNSVSMALYFGGLVARHSSLSVFANAVIYIMLVIFACSVTFGRLYTGMHSMVDVTVGSLIGVAVWASYWWLETTIEAFTVSSAWRVTISIVPTTLFLVFVHPAPAEDCPCFEDAVAFVSVVCGVMVGRTWHTIDFAQSTLGADWNSSLRTAGWSSAVFAKLLIGILAILVWRLAAKEVAHATLPPIFRFLSPYILPRRHYVVATEYDDYKKTDTLLHPIPSILDLPSLDELDSIDISSSSTDDLNGNASRESPPLTFELRNRGGTTFNEDPLDRVAKSALLKARQPEEVKIGDETQNIRRDADVLTKVIVYSGIGYIASILIPTFFLWSGLSV